MNYIQPFFLISLIFIKFIYKKFQALFLFLCIKINKSIPAIYNITRKEIFNFQSFHLLQRLWSTHTRIHFSTCQASVGGRRRTARATKTNEFLINHLLMRRQPLRRVRARQTGRAGPGAFSCISHSPRESNRKRKQRKSEREEQKENNLQADRKKRQKKKRAPGKCFKLHRGSVEAAKGKRKAVPFLTISVP